MHGHLSQDALIKVPAAVVWDVYRTLELARLLNELLQDVFGKIEVVQGDGGVGTILKITFAPGIPGPSYLSEIFTKIDDEMRVKESENIEGGYKDLGFERCGFRLHIIEKDVESCIVRSTIEYEIDDKLKDIASQVNTRPQEIMNGCIGKYLEEKMRSAN
ncbi:hypothetical protein DITRI_Ditri06bG0106800 [Diplodiscus trichospermus]